MKKILILTVFALFVAISPIKAHAFDLGQLIDPLCLFACDDDNGGNTKIVNSYNTNSNINSTVVTTNGGNNYPGTPTYPSGGSQSQLGASCYATPTSGDVGDTIHWRSSTYGGTGDYYIEWSGSNGLSGYGTNITKVYNSAGSKYASITVRSGNQTITRNCSTNVIIRDDHDYDYDYDYDDDYDYDEPLYVSCRANTTRADVDEDVRWSADVDGGNGSYRYEWDGSESLDGSSRNVTISYDNPGIKSASVRVRSGNRSVTRSCSNSVTVTDYNYNYNYNTNYNYNNNVSSGIQIACYPDKTSARVGTPITWGVEATGGYGNYTYFWTGSEGLSSTQNSAVKIYSTTGSKNATVTVTSSNGQTATQVCGNSVTITSASSGTTVKPVPNDTNDDNNDLSAAALFSLKNVPWGWVAVLIILILFGTVLYLIYNRNKI